MVVVLMTDVRRANQAAEILSLLKRGFPALKCNFDLDDYREKPFPCGHSILRAEGMDIDLERIISVVSGSGFQCMELENRICGGTAL